MSLNTGPDSIDLNRCTTMEVAFRGASSNRHALEASFGRQTSRMEAGVTTAFYIYLIRTPAWMHVYTLESILPSSPERLMQASSINANGHCLCKALGLSDELSLQWVLKEPPQENWREQLQSTVSGMENCSMWSVKGACRIKTPSNLMLQTLH